MPSAGYVQSNVPAKGYVQSNGYVQRTASAPMPGRNNGYQQRYPVRGQAMQTAYYGQSGMRTDRLPPPRVTSVTDQVVPADQGPEMNASRPVRQYTR